MMPYRSVSSFYKEKFGQKIYKISFDIGCTCPNRDGTKGFGGCSFCSEGGSGDFAEKIDVFDGNNLEFSIKSAICKAKNRVIAKMPKTSDGNQKFIAYFQSFTNTYERTLGFECLIKIFRETAKSEQIVGIAIGTRPDCLTDKMLDFLSELSKQTYVQLEFGLQTCSDKTASLINRTYPTQIYKQTMKRVKDKAPKIHVVTHIIFGLPGEDEKMMMESVKFAINCKTDGIKITCLHILKGTRLGDKFLENEQTNSSPNSIDGIPFRTLEMDEYLLLIEHALDNIPPDVVIHRLTGDGDKKLLIAPLWSANKKLVLNSLSRRLN